MINTVKNMSCIAVVAVSCLLVGCGSLWKRNVKPLEGPPVHVSVTPYSEALNCLADQLKGRKHFVMAVDTIPDRTGKYSTYEGGYKVTQGAEDIAVSALGKTRGYTLVERLRMNIPFMEIKYANKYLLHDADPYLNASMNGGFPVRKIGRGEMKGSDFILTGSITEINYNLDSGGFEITIDGYGGGWRAFAMDVAMDLRLVDTKSSEIVLVLPMRKQIWGYENKIGVTRFFDTTLVEANAGRKRQEPIGIAVRSVIESSVIEMTKYLYHLSDDVCAEQIAYAENMGKHHAERQRIYAQRQPKVAPAHIAMKAKPKKKAAVKLSKKKDSKKVAVKKAPEKLESALPNTVAKDTSLEQEKVKDHNAKLEKNPIQVSGNEDNNQVKKNDNQQVRVPRPDRYL